MADNLEYIYWVRYEVCNAISGEWDETDAQVPTHEDAAKFAKMVNRESVEDPNFPRKARVMRRLVGPEEEVSID